jgi:DNA mismatch repair ATPase MutS
MVSGDFTKGIDATSAPSPIQPLQLIKKFGIVFVTFIQGIIQPYWSYKHLSSIDTIIVEYGNLITQFRDRYERLQSILSDHGFTFFKCPLPHIRTNRDATARAILEASYFKMALKYIGSLEVIMSLANKKEIHEVQWLQSKTPMFELKDTFDFQVAQSSRKTISTSFHQKNHALLTGPNKGGKSTVLRALSTSALLAHTYGCSIGYAKLTPFQKMFVCLKPDDLPGSKSRFEREIEFTANTLRYEQPILVFIDELYHSTNPPDALRSCKMYCDQLWKKKNMVSVISTHLFELVETADSSIQRLCCSAHLDEKGDIQFEYCLTNGICKVSSVDELLKRNGLFVKQCA